MSSVDPIIPGRTGILPVSCRDRLILIGILLLAAGLRLQYLFQPMVDAFSWRQASTGMMADNFYLRSWNIFFPEVNWTGPGPSYQGREFQIVSYLTAVLHYLFGWHDWFGRLVAISFGLVTVFSLHRLAGLIWNDEHAHAVALIYSVLPAAIMIETSFLPDPAMLALLVLGLWLFVLYWMGGRFWLLPVATVCFTLGVLAKLPGLASGFVVVYLLIVWILRGKVRKSIPAWFAVVFGLGMIVAYYSWAIYLGKTYPPFHVAGSGYIWESGLASFWRDNFFIPKLWNTLVIWFYGWPILLLLVFGIWLPPPVPNADFGRVLAFIPHVWLAGAVLMYFAAAREIVINPWNLHVLNVPVAFFCGRGAMFFVHAGTTSKTSFTVLMRLAILSVAIAVWSIRPNMASMKKEYSAAAYPMGLHLSRLAAPDDLVIAVSPGVGDPIGIYYSRRRGWVFPPGGGTEPWAIFVDDDATAIAQLNDMIDQGAAWFAVTKDAHDKRNRYFLRYHEGFLNYLNETYTLAADTETYLIYQLVGDKSTVRDN